MSHSKHNGTSTSTNNSDAAARTPTATAAEASPFEAAYNSTAPDRAALSTSDLLLVNLDVTATVTSVLGAVPTIKSFRDEVTATFRVVDAAKFDKVETYARALAFAQSAYLAASSPTEDLPTIVERATNIRELLLSDANALAKRGFLDGKRLDDLKGGPGYLNIASDLGVLVRMFREHWNQIAPKTAVQDSELKQGEELYELLILACAQRKQLPVKSAAAADERQRAFTLLLDAYDQTRRIISYLRWDEGDAERIAPSLWAGRGSRRTTAHDGGDNGGTGDGNRPGNSGGNGSGNGTGDGNGTNNGVIHAASEPTPAPPMVAPGLPGGSPFTH